jgi:hypothetical protein
MSEGDVITSIVPGSSSANDAAGRRKAAPRAMPKWETEARERLKGAVRRFARPLSDLVARDANEGDTRLLMTDFLCEGPGFDKYRQTGQNAVEISAIAPTRNSWAGFGDTDHDDSGSPPLEGSSSMSS